MKRILTLNLILGLCWNVGICQESTPWGAFAGTAELEQVAYYKIFNGVPTINQTYLEIGDYIGAFNQDGKIAGITEITELVGGQIPQFTLQIFQDATDTPAIEGPIAGENYSIQYYDLSTDKYYELDHFGPWTATQQNGDQADGDNQSAWDATLEVAPPLSIDLLSFDGQEENGVIRLDWITVLEKDNDYFTIEKSKDGRSFSSIGKVKGRGTHTQKQAYDFVDHAPFEGMNYYRLKNTSKSGAVDYSAVISIKIERTTATTVSLYPNPVSTHLNVEVSSNYKDDMLQLELFDVTGRLVLSQKLDMSDAFSHTIPVQHVAKGTYVVKIVGQTYVQSQKITVK